MTPAIGHERIRGIVERTWPAPETLRMPPWKIRRGLDSGNRTRSATATGPVTKSDVKAAESKMREMGMAPVFMVWDRQGDLDGELERLGYERFEETDVLAADIDSIPEPKAGRAVTADGPFPVSALKRLWREEGIGPGRLGVMEAVSMPKRYFLGRVDDRAAGACFAAIDQEVLTLHAVAVSERFRRRGLGRAITESAARWGRLNGAALMMLMVLRSNSAAKSLYQSQSLRPCARYHYRKQPERREA